MVKQIINNLPPGKCTDKNTYIFKEKKKEKYENSYIENTANGVMF